MSPDSITSPKALIRCLSGARGATSKTRNLCFGVQTARCCNWATQRAPQTGVLDVFATTALLCLYAKVFLLFSQNAGKASVLI